MIKKMPAHEINEIEDLTQTGRMIAEEEGIAIMEIYPLFAGLAEEIRKIKEPGHGNVCKNPESMRLLARRYAAAAIIGYELGGHKSIKIVSFSNVSDEELLNEPVSGEIITVNISRGTVKALEAEDKAQMFERIYETLKLHFEV